MSILVEQPKEAAKQLMLDEVYLEMTTKGSLYRPSAKPPSHAPERMLKASEAGKQVRAFTEIQLKHYQEAHLDHIDQRAKFLGCPYCDGRLECAGSKTTRARRTIPREQREELSGTANEFEFNGPLMPTIEVSELDSVPVPRVIHRRPRATHPADNFGIFVGPRDSIRRDFGTCTKKEGAWTQLTMSPRNRSRGVTSIYLNYVPSPMVSFARWFILHLYPEQFTAAIISPPSDAHQFMQYAWDILRRSESKLLLHGLALPTTEQFDAVLQKIPKELQNSAP